MILRKTWQTPVPYRQALAWMEAHRDAMRHHHAPEAIWFLEHPPIYTIGPLAAPPEGGLPWERTPRGGKVTFHGPGQRVIYCMINLKARQLTVHAYVTSLETWILEALASLGLAAYRHSQHRGLWTTQGKIASVGIHVAAGLATHGIAVNVSTDLAAFRPISPCGLTAEIMTSVHAHGLTLTLAQVDQALWATCPFF